MFLDASKAFDLVDRGKHFSKLLQGGLSYPNVRFLVNWHSSQRLKVRWGNSLSDPIGASNSGRFMKLYKSGLESKSTFGSQIFNELSSFAYRFIGYNLRFDHTHLKNENISDRFMQISRIIRSIRRVFGVVSPFEDLLVNLSCS